MEPIHVKEIINRIAETVRDLARVKTCLTSNNRREEVSCLLDLYERRDRLLALVDDLKKLAVAARYLYGPEFGYVLYYVNNMARDVDKIVKTLDYEINSSTIRKMPTRLIAHEIGDELQELVINMVELADVLRRLGNEDLYIYGTCIIRGEPRTDLKTRYICAGGPTPLIVDRDKIVTYGIDFQGKEYAAELRDHEIKLEFELPVLETGREYYHEILPKDMKCESTIDEEAGTLVYTCRGTVPDMKEILKNIELARELESISPPHVENILRDTMLRGMEIDKNMPLDMNWRRALKLSLPLPG
ncbi:MAG: hypothetical protein GXO26_08240 [Crenarchaeota archaeon]|nr:hypothetical protein [Thermoproteota archaeon]